MVLCIGEILFDMIGSYNGDSFFYERKAGGAPFNVACAIKCFGGSSGFVGSVGNDIIGEYLIKFAENRKLDKLQIVKTDDRNTTLAFVELDVSGERTFCFFRKNTADYILPDISKSFLDAVNIVHIGSLMLSYDCGLNYALSLAEKCRQAGKKVSFDVNYRTDIFNCKVDAVKRYKQVIEKSDIVKFSEDEAEIFTYEYIYSLKNKLICITLGSKGSKWIYNSKSGKVDSIKVNPIDTTGAGDAFYAAVLMHLDGKNFDKLTEDKLNANFRFANVCGALNTLGRGAIDNLPDLNEIKKYI
jgi:fructokinase